MFHHLKMLDFFQEHSFYVILHKLYAINISYINTDFSLGFLKFHYLNSFLPLKLGDNKFIINSKVINMIVYFQPANHSSDEKPII